MGDAYESLEDEPNCDSFLRNLQESEAEHLLRALGEEDFEDFDMIDPNYTQKIPNLQNLPKNLRTNRFVEDEDEKSSPKKVIGIEKLANHKGPIENI